MRKLIAVITLAVALVLAGNGNPSCPRDGSTTSWAGRTAMSQDPPYEMMYQYRCTQWGHLFWSSYAPGTVP